jgi:opacity protein-like surface antigen
MTRFIVIAAAAVAALSAAASAQQPAAPQQTAPQQQLAPQPQTAPQGLRGNWLQADYSRQQAQQRADAMFQRLDANHDGTLTRDEAHKAGPAMGRGGERVERLIARLFGDAQSVTLAQFQAQALARFDRQDLNHDGVVTGDERQQARAAWQDERGN